ncbi:peptidoglycan-binding protein [Leifsonia sp. ku-ls]|nr:peptidoglycan-binding protein [Leifsonia sp. ku-ls]
MSSPRTGRLTAFDCAAGAELRSGTAPLAIDGRRLVALATHAPLWRSLVTGDRGDDVLAVQSELTRLGYATDQDGVMGRSTFRALSALRNDLKVPATADSVLDVSDIVWLPGAKLLVNQCDGVLGTDIVSGDELIRLPDKAVSARLSTVPSSRVPGPRQLMVGSLTIPVGDDGAVTSAEALDGLSSLPEFAVAAQKGGTASIPATWVLAKPVPALVVPPTALWDVRDGTACLQPAHGRPILVQVLGSDLGQSFVSPRENVDLGDVTASPRKAQTCR